ncbi:MAG: SPFH domain-containing protein [Acidobacteria bacterium]|nr:SPFH domain-containing protein [Acidobacteriota bacterium]
MFGIRYFKATPTQYVFHYSRGRLRRQGRGLTFFYWGPAARLLVVPAASSDVPFAVACTTADFQQVTVQGQLTYSVGDPAACARLLDFEVDPNGRARGDGATVLRERLTHAVQVLLDGFVRQRALRAVLVERDAMNAEVGAGLRGFASLRAMGVEVLNLDLLAVTPTPDTARALEAPTREALLKEADDSTYERRNSAVEQERRIKENELRTEIAVEEKKRQIRETKMAADITIEDQRTHLVEMRSANDRAEADVRGYALEATIKPLRSIDWRTLTAASGGSKDPRGMIALAFRELAENAQKIGQLNISPDLLQTLLKAEAK